MSAPQPLDPAADAVAAPARLAALRRARLLDTPADEEFDRITALAANLLRAPVALVSLVDEDRQFFKSARGLGEPWQSARQMPLDMSLCKLAVRDGATVAIADARRDPRVRDMPKVPESGTVAYAGAPLTLADGHTLGTLCVIDERPREWEPGELALLAELAASAVAAIERRAARRDLAPPPADPAAVLADADALWQAADELLVALAARDAQPDDRDVASRAAAAERALLVLADRFGRETAALLGAMSPALAMAARALWLGALYYVERVTVRRATAARAEQGLAAAEEAQRATLLVRTAEAEVERTATAYRRARLARGLGA